MCSYPIFLIWAPRNLFLYSLARTAFVPIFLMCNIQRATSTSSPPIINSDIIYMLILLAFGITNGHLCSLCMMAAPSPEHNEELKREHIDTAAIVAQFCLVAGLAIGAIASFAVRAAVCNCNPFIS
jgi:solute carrier family 29 (equilibrative nucleoside transporter), member 1/2/3